MALVNKRIFEERQYLTRTYEPLSGRRDETLGPLEPRSFDAALQSLAEVLPLPVEAFSDNRGYRQNRFVGEPYHVLVRYTLDRVESDTMFGVEPAANPKVYVSVVGENARVDQLRVDLAARLGLR